MKKVNAKQVMTSVALVGLLGFLAVYFLVFQAYSDKADEITQSNAVLSKRVNELREYYNNMDNYNAEIADMQEQVNVWLDTFPADVKEEDIIVLALDTEKKAIVNYTNINIGEREELASIPAEVVKNAGMENLEGELKFVKRQTSYVNETEYFSLKDCVKTINDSNNRLAISNISYASDDDNKLILNGTIDVTFYSVIGTGKEYVPQNLPAYESGLPILFGFPGIDEILPEEAEGAEDGTEAEQ